MTGLEILSMISDISSVASGIVTIAGAVLSQVTLNKKANKQIMERIIQNDLNGLREDIISNEDISLRQKYMMYNFITIAEMARLYDSEVCEDPQYDFEWFMRFYDASGGVGEEYLQSLWAKLLSEEVKMPSSYSLRTIETLRNISCQEARLFNRISPFFVCSENKNIFLPNYHDYLDHFDIDYSEIMDLSEVGLIYMEGDLTGQLQLDTNGKVFYVRKSSVISICSIDESGKTIKIKQFPLTKVGREIYSLLDVDTSYEGFLLLCNEINKMDGVSARVSRSEKTANGYYKITI